MKRLIPAMVCFGSLFLAGTESQAQINLIKDFTNYKSAAIGTFQGINFREGGFSGIFPVANTDGKEFWVCSDRGVNVDAANANTSSCRPTYDKIYAFPTYAPKIHRIRLNGDSVQILQTITMKRPDGTNATGIINPTGFGSASTEVASTDTVQDCANFSSKVAAKDIWGIDAEGIVVDRQGFFWVCEEGGPTIWKINQNGVVVKRYTPFANLLGAMPQDVQIDSVFKYRKNNRGFEGISIAPNGRIYAIIQSPILYPTTSTGENSRVHRILEIDPATNVTRMFAYLNDGVIGASGSNQIRLKDWKIGDMAAINDSTFLVLEAALRGTTDIKRMYMININGATNVTSGLYSGSTLEALVDSAGLAANSIVPVKKTLYMDLLANGWPSVLDKAEGLTVLNDSTILIANDNDYGQYSPAENGIATATANACHVFKYGLTGTKKLGTFRPVEPTMSQGQTAQNTSTTPYLQPTVAGGKFTSILSAGDSVNGYKMVGTPDGLGAFDNNNGTFTLLMNHEFGNTAGAVHAYGSTGAFVSKWVINKSDLSVVGGEDLTKKIYLWNTATQSYVAYNSAFPSTTAALSRHCSADLPAVSAFYNSVSGLGTEARIFMNGEENGTDGRGFAHIATGPEAGSSYELPALGKFGWENSVAAPGFGDKTVVIGLDDATPGQVYVYIGSKANVGNEIEKAGLTNGKLYGVAVTGLLNETSASVPTPNTSFTLADLGYVKNSTGATLNTLSDNAGVTRFLRPEDGAWDPTNPTDFYFATTNAFNAPSRLWRLRFNSLSNPTGGTIAAVLDGTEGQQMMDNIGIDNSGHILITEDVGGNAHIGKIWQYNIATDVLSVVGMHDTTRFISGRPGFLTQDEEATGIVDVQSILGPGMFVVADQAHYGIAGEFVEGGQLLAFYNPTTAVSNPEVNLQGNNVTIADGDLVPSTTDNTDFGKANLGATISKSYTLQNAGPGALVVTGINMTGANASDFAFNGSMTFPLTIAANSTQMINVNFVASALGARTATLNVMSNDLNEGVYDVMLKGEGTTPEIAIQGNGLTVADGDQTSGVANNTDFGMVDRNSTKAKSFVIQNTGSGELTVTGINFTGVNASVFSLMSAPTFPMTIAANSAATINVQFAPVAVGTHTATLNVLSNDVDESAYDFAVQGIGQDPTSVSTVSNASFVKLYPNPTGDAATVSMMLEKDEHVRITVYDIQGKLVMNAIEKELNAGEQHVAISTAQLQNGNYFVHIATSKGTAKIKMAVLH